MFHRDTAGQERFNSIRTSFFRGAKVCMGVCMCECIKTLIVMILVYLLTAY